MKSELLAIKDNHPRTGVRGGRLPLDCLEGEIEILREQQANDTAQISSLLQKNLVLEEHTLALTQDAADLQTSEWSLWVHRREVY